jgi:hypothetical protein
MCSLPGCDGEKIATEAWIYVLRLWAALAFPSQVHTTALRS